MNDPPDVFRATALARGIACFVGFAAIVLALRVVHVQAQDPEPATWPIGVAFIATLFLVARATWLVRVAVDDAGVAVHTGWHPFTIPWELVQGIWLYRHQKFGGVCLLVGPDQIVQLPFARALNPARPNATEADRLMGTLSSWAVRMHAPLLPPAEIRQEAERRLPGGPPPRRLDR